MSASLIVDPGGKQLATHEDLTPDKVQLLKDTVCRGATDLELALFVQVCRSKRLDPFAKQIHAVKRPQRDDRTGEYRDVMTFQTGIDGYRLIAERTGRYAGQDQPMWCGEDGEWREVWLAKTPPAAARASVYRNGFEKPLVRVARWGAYVQTKRDGTPNSMWQKMGPEQLHKCAEALALRAAFPEELSGLYTTEEMGQASNGSREEQQEVAQRLIADGAEELAQTKAATETSGKKSTDFKMLKKFGTAKDKLGDEDYYRILGNFGFAHANDILDSDTGAKVLRAMAGWLNVSEPWVRLQGRDKARFDDLLLAEGCQSIAEAAAHGDSAGILTRLQLAMSVPQGPKEKLEALRKQYGDKAYWQVVGGSYGYDEEMIEQASPQALDKLLVTVQAELELGV